MLNISIILITALIIEVISLIGRFALKISIKEQYIKFRKKSRRGLIRVHHGVWGLLLASLAFLLENNLFVNVGLGIALSDIVHHTILKVITGSFEF